MNLKLEGRRITDNEMNHYIKGINKMGYRLEGKLVKKGEKFTLTEGRNLICLVEQATIYIYKDFHKSVEEFFENFRAFCHRTEPKNGNDDKFDYYSRWFIFYEIHAESEISDIKALLDSIED